MVYKPYLGFANGLSRDEGSHLLTQVRFGVFRDLANPVSELLGVAVEGYGGLRDVQFDYGVRAFALSHLLCLGAGVDYDLRHGTPDLLLTLVAPVRRGGVFGRGSDLRLEWLPTRGGTVNLALTLPVAQRRRGRGRPRQDHVELRDPPPPAFTFRPVDSALVQALADVRETGEWVNRMMVPSLRGSPGDTAGPRAALKARLAGHTAEVEIRAYHRALTRAFALALSGDTLGARVAARATAVLLESVLLPYNRLLGQTKKKDTTRGFGRDARGSFARWLFAESGVPQDRVEAAAYVFQALLDLVEDIRATNRESLGDSRLVWLPLQLALLPEQYDEQDEVDGLIGRAAAESLTQGNRAWYIPNERFQPELIRSIARAQDYHVLWVHDFHGKDEQGRPDRATVAVVIQAYLAALRQRVEQYDSTGRLPVYMILLDQFYFEQSHSRSLLGLLEHPLEGPLTAPTDSDSLQRAIVTAQQQLRRAVQASRLLQTERAQYGEEWLRALVKVHVSITNSADPSFRSGDIFPVVGIPDDVMRDHRKVVLYDVSEGDPYRGMAMYTGMGVGKQYSGPAWEDRAIMLQGPAALELRDKARQLLQIQGIPAADLPLVLRPQARAPDYAARVQAHIDSVERQGEVAAGVLEAHNNTGFAPKQIAVAEATLFNLMAPGGVVKVPDSMWLNGLFGSLLAGAALRGVHVLVIAPSKSSAPDLGWPVVALIHDLLSRFIAFQHDLGAALKESGGELRAGLYEPTTRVDDLPGRVTALKRSLEASQFLRDLYAFDPAVSRVLDSAEALLGAGPTDSAGPVSNLAAQPKLHMKGFVYLSREAWDELVSGAPMVACLREYLMQRARQIEAGPRADDQAMTRALARVGARAIQPVIQTLSSSARQRLVLYLQVGSPNQNYRSMAMDGEAAVLVSGLTSFDAVPDYLLLTGLATWLDDEAELDRGLPPPSGLKTKLARWVRMAL